MQKWVNKCLPDQPSDRCKTHDWIEISLEKTANFDAQLHTINSAAVMAKLTIAPALLGYNLLTQSCRSRRYLHSAEKIVFFYPLWAWRVHVICFQTASPSTFASKNRRNIHKKPWTLQLKWYGLEGVLSVLQQDIYKYLVFLLLPMRIAAYFCSCSTIFISNAEV